MKALVTSILIMVLLLGSWWGFSYFADNSLHELMETSKKDILKAIADEDWQKADNKMKEVSEQWHKDKKIYSLYFRTSAINDTDYSIARAKEYIKRKDSSNSSGEISCLIEQLKFLHGNEILSIENLF